MKVKRVIESIGVYTEDGTTRLGGVVFHVWEPEDGSYWAYRWRAGTAVSATQHASFDAATDYLVGKHEEVTNG